MIQFIQENSTSALLEQIKAANEIYKKHLKDWLLADRSLALLKKSGFAGEETCLIKIAAIDLLYSTGLRFSPGHREKIARQLSKQSAEIEKHIDGPICLELVEKIGTVGRKKHISFASKFCHFFISEQYPIFDELAQKTLANLVRTKMRPEIDAYRQFYNSIDWIRKRLDLKISVSELDRYLWLTGRYKNRSPSLKTPSDEVAEFFEENKESELLDKFLGRSSIK